MSDRFRSAAWRILAILPLWFTGTFVLDGTVDPVVRVLVAAVGLITVVRPVQGLLLFAIVAPLGDLIRVVFEVGAVRLTEAAAMAFLAGWLIRAPAGWHRGPAPRRTITYGAFALASLALASMIVQVLVIRARFPAVWSVLWPQLWQQYYRPTIDLFGGVAMFRWFEGLGIAAAVIVLFRRAPAIAVRVPEALGIGCVVAVVATVLLRAGIAYPEIVARQALLGPRIVAHVADVNAAGSYFALMLCLACGMGARARGREAAGWLAVGFGAAIGLWLGGSRSAEGAAVIVFLPAIPWALARRWSPRVRYATIGVVLLAVAAAVAIGSQVRDSHDQGALYRLLFTQTSYRMTLAGPWFGVGVGQYYGLSPLFLAPRLAWTYGAENAHDYFLQTAAELGVIGLGASLLALCGVIVGAVRAMAAAPRDFRLLGLAGGVLAYLLTCLMGHPLLVFETAYPFWLSLGLLIALSSPVALAPSAASARWPRIACAVGVVALAASIPFRARQGLPVLKLGQGIEGLYGWETETDGRRYRRAEDYASVFVESGAGHVDIPVRAQKDDSEIELIVDKGAVQKFAVGRGWSTLAVDLPPTGPTTRYRRINMKSGGAQIGIVRAR